MKRRKFRLFDEQALSFCLFITFIVLSFHLSIIPVLTFLINIFYRVRIVPGDLRISLGLCQMFCYRNFIHKISSKGPCLSSHIVSFKWYFLHCASVFNNLLYRISYFSFRYHWAYVIIIIRFAPFLHNATQNCDLFDKMKLFLKEQGTNVVKKVGFVYYFKIA